MTNLIQSFFVAYKANALKSMFCLTSSPWSFKMDSLGRIIVRATLGSEMRPRFAKIGGHSLLQTVNLQVLEIAGSSFQER